MKKRSGRKEWQRERKEQEKNVHRQQCRKYNTGAPGQGIPRNLKALKEVNFCNFLNRRYYCFEQYDKTRFATGSTRKVMLPT